MKKHDVELTVQAQEQILQIACYIKEELQAPEAAERFIDKMESEISKLSVMPERTLLVEEEPWYNKGVHKFIVSNYIIYYIIIGSDEIVQVIAVIPARRDQKKQLEMMTFD
ncbi:MAG: type II toxin-antitoxin system RelE/ParE family toxin [Firmicutes bacterium]|nr:type II toxin-antitoxin system RelE/ParE family toxin [Bacillota bacterium]